MVFALTVLLCWHGYCKKGDIFCSVVRQSTNFVCIPKQKIQLMKMGQSAFDSRNY